MRQGRRDIVPYCSSIFPAGCTYYEHMERLKWYLCCQEVGYMVGSMVVKLGIIQCDNFDSLITGMENFVVFISCFEE